MRLRVSFNIDSRLQSGKQLVSVQSLAVPRLIVTRSRSDWLFVQAIMLFACYCISHLISNKQIAAVTLAFTLVIGSSLWAVRRRPELDSVLVEDR